MHYEYKVVPAPGKGVRSKGVKGSEGRFAVAVERTMNDMAARGWEYVRSETLPSEERTGLTGTATVWRNLLVFRRGAQADARGLTPKMLEAPLVLDQPIKAGRPQDTAANEVVADAAAPLRRARKGPRHERPRPLDAAAPAAVVGKALEPWTAPVVEDVEGTEDETPKDQQSLVQEQATAAVHTSDDDLWADSEDDILETDSDDVEEILTPEDTAEADEDVEEVLWPEDTAETEDDDVEEVLWPEEAAEADDDDVEEVLWPEEAAEADDDDIDALWANDEDSEPESMDAILGDAQRAEASDDIDAVLGSDETAEDDDDDDIEEVLWPEEKPKAPAAEEAPAPEPIAQGEPEVDPLDLMMQVRSKLTSGVAQPEQSKPDEAAPEATGESANDSAERAAASLVQNLEQAASSPEQDATTLKSEGDAERAAAALVQSMANDTTAEEPDSADAKTDAVPTPDQTQPIAKTADPQPAAPRQKVRVTAPPHLTEDLRRQAPGQRRDAADLAVTEPRGKAKDLAPVSSLEDKLAARFRIEDGDNGVEDTGSVGAVPGALMARAARLKKVGS